MCIHGHWYQPPRENPFTGRVDDQPSAAPFPNWNERITAECYLPNTKAEILDHDGSVRRRLNNYEYISSDWGPTLLEWLEIHSPETYGAIIEADRVSVDRFGGYGSGLAHTYNHTILPLSNTRDKKTQILWGIADFVHRFGRRPEGIWLPETAVDLESLAIALDAGVRFTVLSPYQASAVEADGAWLDVEDGSVDPRFPYAVELGDAHQVGVFFYDGPLSQEVAFNGMLEDGTLLAKRLVDALGEPADEAVLAHVATDGETYGHHHRHGEMALARAIEELEADPGVELTNYARFLTDHPPSRRAKVLEGTSWSCAHGVERWRSNCGCSSGRHPDWHQEWRAPLREALDHLRDRMVGEFEGRGGTVLEDPWDARDHYIEVILGGAPEDFLARHGRRGLDDGQARLAIDLLEIQHRAMLMYTSCGWFFDDVSGLETVFVLRHAGRVIDLSRRVLGIDMEPGFLAILDRAPSNVDARTGRDVYLASVGPYMTG